MIKDEGTEQLLRLLHAAAAKLRAHGSEHWARWLEADAASVRARDAEGLRHFLSAFGGMGSLGDRFLSDPLATTLSDAYAIARELWRDFQAAPPPAS